MLSTPAYFTDAKGAVIPIFVRRSFSEGLNPWEFYAATFGARQGVLSTKFATREAGDLGKQMNLVSEGLTVTEDDCGTVSGIPVAADDKDNIGALLARATGGYPLGTPITAKVMKKLQEKGIKRLLLRSPVTCQAKDGLCKLCVGQREDGKLPGLRDAIGIKASSALAERIAQGALNCLAEGTLVRMGDLSVRAIESIKIGEIVLGSDLSGTVFPIQVTGVWDQGIQDVATYTYRMGSTKQFLSVSCTAVHELLSNTKKSSCREERLNKQLRKLPAGYRCHDLAAVLPQTMQGVTGQSVHSALAVMVGVWLGDGCRNNGVGPPVISCADLKQVDDLQPLLAELQLRLQKCKRSHDWRVVSPVGCASNRLKDYLARLGILSLYAHEKTLPCQVWSWSAGALARLVAGYLATDGSVFRNASGQLGVSFSSTSRELLAGIKDLFAVRFCIYGGSISRTGKADTGNYKHDCFSFYITRLPEIRRLAELIGPYIPGVKRERLVQLVAAAQYSHHDPFYRCPRKRVESAGKQRCWDLTVDHPDALFVLANGLIVSNTKHVASAGGKGAVSSGQVYAGFDVINQIAQVPEAFRHAATLAAVNGKISRVEAAPQGGTNIFVGDQLHYVDPEHALHVKIGDDVEAGDQLSGGIVNPAEVVNYKGIGEGRRYFAERFAQAFRDSGIAVNRRNTEVLARALVGAVQVDEPEGLGDYLPGDVVSYDALAYSYQPRADAQIIKTGDAVGRYLEQPALHHTIGTRLTNKMATELSDFGVDKVRVHTRPVAFTPQMTRLRTAAHYGKDWLAKLHGTYLKSNLLSDVQSVSESNIHGTHPIPAIAYGVELGESKPGKVTY
jgi:hypothetical protein